MVRLGNLLQDSIAVLEKIQHIARKHNSFYENSKQRHGRCEDKFIRHFRLIGSQCFKGVIMSHKAKRSFDHCVLKIARPVERCDLAREVLFHAQVRRFPPYRLPHTDKTGNDTAYRLFSGLLSAKQMQFDAACKVETAFDGSVDDRAEVQFHHRITDTYSRARLQPYTATGTAATGTTCFFGPRFRATSTRIRSSISAALHEPLGRNASAALARS